MRTIDDPATRDASGLQRFVRDLRLLRRIARMLRAYLIEGRRVRQRYRELAARGETFWVDEELGA